MVLTTQIATRRELIRMAGGVAAATMVPTRVLSEESCNPVQCSAYIPSGQFGHIQQPLPSVWCWAATIAMICNWHGCRMDQSSVVRQCFGAYVNAPADPFTLINSINRSYIDDAGRSFTLSSKVWSVLHGVTNLNNLGIIGELKQRKPLVVCNTSHMMALVGVSYLRANGEIYEAWVADPAVYGPVTHGIPGMQPLASGFRYLMPAEMTPAPAGGALMFVAAVDVV